MERNTTQLKLKTFQRLIGTVLPKWKPLQKKWSKLHRPKAQQVRIAILFLRIAYPQQTEGTAYSNSLICSNDEF